MTSRERLLASIEHRVPDKVPLDLGATPSSGISAIAYAKLRDHLHINEGSTDVYDVVQQLAQPEEKILDRFGVDVVDIGRTFNTNDSDWTETILASGHSARYPAWFKPEQEADGTWLARHHDGSSIARMPSGATFIDQT
jgi:uroporphyrinogen decarboxylase